MITGKNSKQRVSKLDQMGCLVWVCVQTALEAVAPGGRIVLVGLGAEKCCVPTMQTVFKEIDFMGSFRYTNTVSFLPLR